MSAPALPLACRREGSGPPVVLMHGLFGAGRNWQGIARALSGRFEVLLPDLRNHGASPWSAEAGYRAMAGDVLALLDRLGLDRARIVGHSMGGKVAMVVALTAPERVERLAVVDIAPVAYPPALEAYIAAMRAVDLARMSRRAEADAALAAAVPEPGIRAFLLQNLEQKEGRLAWRLNLDALAAAMPEIRGFPDLPEARPYAGPTCFIYGALSGYVRPAEHRPAILRLFPGATFRAVEGAGHWVHAERPAEFLAALEGCLGG